VAKQQQSGYYVTDMSNAITAGGKIWSGWGAGIFSQEAIWASAITPKIASGGKLVDLLDDWQTAIKNQAQVDGYNVS
jgi:multiple sugar transport system substrate-binding protein